MAESSKDHDPVFAWEGLTSPSRTGVSFGQWTWLIPSHLLVFICTWWYSAVLNAGGLLGATTKCSVQDHDDILSPFTSALKFDITRKHEDAWSDQLYVAEPSDASERAWDELIGLRGARISPKEASDAGIVHGLPLDNGDIAALPAVKHNLHCLRRLRQSLYSDVYYLNYTENEASYIRQHDLHCLEVLRQSLICTPDVTPLPYFRSEREGHDLTPRPDVLQRCADWDVLQAELNERKIADPPSLTDRHQGRRMASVP